MKKKYFLQFQFSFVIAAARRPLPPKPTPAAAPRKYNPANIYGAPVARKSNERSVIRSWNNCDLFKFFLL